MKKKNDKGSTFVKGFRFRNKETYDKFRRICFLQGRNMGRTIEIFMEEYIWDYEEEKKLKQKKRQEILSKK